MAAIYTGGSASVLYGYEGATTFGTASTAITNIFGMNQKVTSLSLQTGQMPLNKLGQVEVSKFAYGQQTGSVNIGFVWDSGKSDKIFKALFGAPSGTGQDIYPASSTAPFGASSGGVAVSPSSPLSLTTQIHQVISHVVGSTTNTLLNRTLKGCIVQSLGLSTSIGETLNATLDMAFAKEDTSSVIASTGFVEQTASANDQATTPYTFAHGVLQTSTGASSIATIAEVQDVDITLATNAELLWGLGSHHASTVFRKIFDVTGRFKTSSKNGDLIQSVIDQSIVAGTEEMNTANVSLDLTFTDGAKSLKIELGGISITDHSTSGIEPAEPIFEEVNIKAKSIRIVSDHT
jgi:hypothetical protein